MDKIWKIFELKTYEIEEDDIDGCNLLVEHKDSRLTEGLNSF